MHPSHFAASKPASPAVIMAESGETISYAALDAAANRGAHLLRRLGLRRGDVIAVMADNDAMLFDIGWAAQRTGLYLTSISTRLSQADVGYILRDSGARLLIASDRLAPVVAGLRNELAEVQAFLFAQPALGIASWREACADLPSSPVADESAGADMLYSSGTTGRPKGVKPELPEGPIDAPTPLMGMGTALYGMGEDCVYLSTSPLYHAAPLRWAMTIHRLGGCVIVMEKFDPEEALRLIERYRITHATWVPTHFVRLLRLPDTVRNRHDLSSLRAVVHAAAPCPAPVKQAMIDWWGPIVHEYYSGTECCGITALSAEEWLAKPGSVGRAVLGTIHILDEDGTELPVGETGGVYFSDGPAFSYHNDPAKTAQAHSPQGWATLGDIGHVDGDGYLYLTDRKSFMIISGGVNIYPQEIENRLATHPAVADIAVIGLPDEEMGERVVAVVQPADAAADHAELAAELTRFAREQLGGVKTPRQFLFRAELPREATGKMMKRRLIDELRGGDAA